MDSSSKVLCWRIALGEEKLKEPLTQEEKELVKEFREEVEEYRKAGMEDFLYAIDFDLE